MSVTRLSLAALGATLRARANGDGKLFMCTGKRSFVDSGAQALLTASLSGLQVTRYEDSAAVTGEDQVCRAARALRTSGARIVLAVGGGGVLDLAKAARACVASRRTLRELLAEPERMSASGEIALYAVPTTAGSGSEATRFATVYIDQVKHSLDHPALRPDAAVVDARFSATMPAQLTAQCGMDALSQAIESYWAVAASEISRADALRAIDLALAHLPDAVCRPSNASRSAMAEAAHLAGRAIDHSRTTAAHALSYPLTMRYGIAHGHAVALSLPAFVALNADPQRIRLGLRDGVEPRAHVARMGALLRRLQADSPAAAAQAVRGLMQTIGLRTSLSTLGVPRDALEHLLAGVNPQRLGNNPVRIDATDLERIVLGLWDGSQAGS